MPVSSRFSILSKKCEALTGILSFGLLRTKGVLLVAVLLSGHSLTALGQGYGVGSQPPEACIIDRVNVNSIEALKTAGAFSSKGKLLTEKVINLGISFLFDTAIAQGLSFTTSAGIGEALTWSNRALTATNASGIDDYLLGANNFNDRKEGLVTEAAEALFSELADSEREIDNLYMRINGRRVFPTSKASVETRKGDIYYPRASASFLRNTRAETDAECAIPYWADLVTPGQYPMRKCVAGASISIFEEDGGIDDPLGSLNVPYIDVPELAYILDDVRDQTITEALDIIHSDRNLVLAPRAEDGSVYQIDWDIEQYRGSINDIPEILYLNQFGMWDPLVEKGPPSDSSIETRIPSYGQPTCPAGYYQAFGGSCKLAPNCGSVITELTDVSSLVDGSIIALRSTEDLRGEPRPEDVTVASLTMPVVAGLYVKNTEDGGQAGSLSALLVNRLNPNRRDTQWLVRKVGGPNQYTLESKSTGKLLGPCTVGCGGAFALFNTLQSPTVSYEPGDPEAVWTIEMDGDKFLFKAFDGSYLTYKKYDDTRVPDHVLLRPGGITDRGKWNVVVIPRPIKRVSGALSGAINATDLLIEPGQTLSINSGTLLQKTSTLVNEGTLIINSRLAIGRGSVLTNRGLIIVRNALQVDGFLENFDQLIVSNGRVFIDGIVKNTVSGVIDNNFGGYWIGDGELFNQGEVFEAVPKLIYTDSAGEPFRRGDVYLASINAGRTCQSTLRGEWDSVARKCTASGFEVASDEQFIIGEQVTLEVEGVSYNRGLIRNAGILDNSLPLVPGSFAEVMNCGAYIGDNPLAGLAPCVESAGATACFARGGEYSELSKKCVFSSRLTVSNSLVIPRGETWEVSYLDIEPPGLVIVDEGASLRIIGLYNEGRLKNFGSIGLLGGDLYDAVVENSGYIENQGQLSAEVDDFYGDSVFIQGCSAQPLMPSIVQDPDSQRYFQPQQSQEITLQSNCVPLIIGDVDSDDDGVPDVTDVFPFDGSETVDTDGDGVGDEVDIFPNDASEQLDTDGDGVGDSADIFPNDATETLDSDGDGFGDNDDEFPRDRENYRALSVDESQGWISNAVQFLPSGVLPAKTDGELTMPFGIVSFRLEGGIAGSTATVTVSFDEELEEGMSWWKYGPILGNPIAHWYEFSGASISGNTVTLTITDGGEGDDDGEVNGVIVDPGGLGMLLPAVAPGASPPGASSHPVPVAPFWLLLILSGLMTLLGARKVMRIRGAASLIKNQD
jgi:hypothetical protein